MMTGAGIGLFGMAIIGFVLMLVFRKIGAILTRGEFTDEFDEHLQEELDMEEELERFRFEEDSLNPLNKKEKT